MKHQHQMAACCVIMIVCCVVLAVSGGNRLRQGNVSEPYTSDVPPDTPPDWTVNHPDYQAEIVDNGDGTVSIFPAKAYR